VFKYLIADLNLNADPMSVFVKMSYLSGTIHVLLA